MEKFGFTTNIERRVPGTGKVYMIDRMTSDWAVAHPLDVDGFIEDVYQKYLMMAEDDPSLKGSSTLTATGGRILPVWRCGTWLATTGVAVCAMAMCCRSVARRSGLPVCLMVGGFRCRRKTCICSRTHSHQSFDKLRNR